MKHRGGSQFRLALCLPLVLLLVQHTQQYSSGAPPKACEKMLPLHNNIQPQASVAPYAIRPWTTQVHQGGTMNLTLYSPSNVVIGGFLLQAKTAQTSNTIGKWTGLPLKTRVAKCLADADSATHTSPESKSNLVFTWTAPDDFLGAVFFRATVAESYSQFWGNVDSKLVEVVTPGTVITSTPLPETAPTSSPTHTDPTFISPTVAAPVKNDPFYEGCDTNKLCFGSTANCVANQNCVAVVSVLVQGETYTFELKGTESPGYVAAGLSRDKTMGDDSSMECTQVNGRVSAFTSWTYPKVDPYVSRANLSQNIIQLVSSSYNDGVLTCKFTRDVRSVVKGMTFDLVNDRYHLMIVSGDQVHANNVGFHSKAFTRTEDAISLSEVGPPAGASKLLLRLHGSFMIAAWIGTASCGILLARYFRQTWVGSQLGGKDLWFAWHQIFMVSTWLLTVASFIIILVDVGGWGGTGDNPHAILGIVTIVLCFLQPIGAFFRPHPNTSKRPIFNWLHWFFGNAAHILGIVTIFFAVYLNKAELPGWTVYILVAFVAFHVIMHLILSIAMCVSDGRISNGRVNSFPMKDLMTNNRPSLNHDRKMDAPHSGFRKLLLGVYYTIIILVVIALICLVSLAPIEDTLESVSKVISGNKDAN